MISNMIFVMIDLNHKRRTIKTNTFVLLSMQSLYKQITVLIFLSAFVAHTIGNGFYIADYYLNTSKYAKNCVNKAKPKLKCNGKCQLMKKIQEQEKKEKQNEEKELSSRFELTMSDRSYFIIIDDRFTINKPILPLYQNTIRLLNFSSSVFHPPC